MSSIRIVYLDSHSVYLNSAGSCIRSILNRSLDNVQVYGKQSPMWLNIINGTLCVLLFFVTIVSSISSVRYIVVDSVNYHVFANL